MVDNVHFPFLQCVVVTVIVDSKVTGTEGEAEVSGFEMNEVVYVEPENMVKELLDAVKVEVA